MRPPRRLRVDQMGAAAKAQKACAQLSERATSAETRAAFLEAEAVARRREIATLQTANKELERMQPEAA